MQSLMRFLLHPKLALHGESQIGLLLFFWPNANFFANLRGNCKLQPIIAVVSYVRMYWNFMNLQQELPREV